MAKISSFYTSDVNLWDDYVEGDDTYMKLESNNGLKEQHTILSDIKTYLESHFTDHAFSMELEKHDSYEIYPTLKDSGLPNVIYWKIVFHDLTYVEKDIIISHLRENYNIIIKGHRIKFYSES